MGVVQTFRPRSLDEATKLLSQYQGEISICAGGTDLFVMMRKGKTTPRYLLDLSRLPLDYCEEESDGLRIGANKTLTALQTSCLAGRAPYRALLQAANHVGSLQIRNMATVAGNICTGITSADVIAPMIALDAELCVAGVNGRRRIPAAEFVVGNRRLALAPEELVYEVFLPQQSAETRSYFRKVGTRKELFISVVNLAIVIDQDVSGLVRKCRLAMGVMAPKTLRLHAAEQELEGKSLTTKTIEASIRAMKTEVSPRSSHHGSREYRLLVAENLLRDYLTAERKRGTAK